MHSRINDNSLWKLPTQRGENGTGLREVKIKEKKTAMWNSDDIA